MVPRPGKRRAVGMHGHGHHKMNVQRICFACNASTRIWHPCLHLAVLRASAQALDKLSHPMPLESKATAAEEQASSFDTLESHMARALLLAGRGAVGSLGVSTSDE